MAKYKEAIKAHRAGQQSILNASARAAQNQDPDRVAEASRLATRFGIDVHSAASNLDQLKRHAQFLDMPLEAVHRDSPVLAEWISSADNLSVASDDLPALAKLEQAITAPQTDSTGVLPQGFRFSPQGTILQVDGVGPGLDREFQTFEDLDEHLREQTLRQFAQQGDAEALAQRFDEDFGPFSNFVAGAAGSLGRTQQAFGVGTADSRRGLEETLLVSQLINPDLSGDLQRGVGGLAADLPLMLLGGPVGRLGAGLAQAGRLSQLLRPYIGQTLASRIPGFAAGAGASLPLATVSGVAEGKESGLASGVGAFLSESIIPGLFGRTGVERALVGGGDDLARNTAYRLIRESGLEATEEAVTEVANALSEVLTGSDPDALNADNLGRRVTVAAILGGGAGAAFNLPEVIADAASAREAQAFQKRVGLMQERIKESKLLERAGEKLGDLVKRMTSKGQDRVYFQAEDWAEVFDAQGLDPQEAADAYGVGESFREAVVTGSEMEVPLETLLLQSGMPEAQGLLERVRQAPGAQSAMEAEGAAERIPEAIERALAEIEDQSNLEPSDASESIRADITGQLLGAGMGLDEAETNAELAARVFSTLGQRTGQDPLELFRRYNLRIRRPVAGSMGEDAIDAALDRIRAGTTAEPEWREPSEDEASLVEAIRDDELRDGLDAQGMERAREAKAELSRRGLDWQMNSDNRMEVREDPQAEQRDLQALSDFLDDMGIDLQEVDNQTARQAIQQAEQEDGQELNQPATVDEFIASQPERVQDQLRAIAAQERAAQAERGVEDESAVLGNVRQMAMILAPDRNIGQRVLWQSAYQGDTGDIKRGLIRFGANRSFTIELLENANLSTFLHEMGHFYLEVLGDLAQAEGAPQQIRDDFQAILEWTGVEGREQIGTEQHEQWARAFEAYLRQGKAPAVGIRKAFATFGAWLKGIYRSLTQLNVNLTPEVVGVMDRMVATDEEIQQAEDLMGTDPVWTSAEDADMDPKDWEKYQRLMAEAQEEATQQLTQELLQEEARVRKQWWKDQRKSTENEVRQEIDRDRVQVAVAILQRGKMPSGADMPEGMESIKLDRKALVDQFTEQVLPRLPGGDRVYKIDGKEVRRSNSRNRGPEVYTTKKGKGLTPSEAARVLGFRNGDELVQALQNAQDYESSVQAEVDRRMRDRYGDIELDGQMAVKAREAVQNGKLAERLEFEARRLAIAAGLPMPSTKILRDAARQTVGRQRIRDLRPDKYLIAARKAAKEAGRAAGKREGAEGTREIDWAVKAYEAKQRELLNHYLFKAASDARTKVDKDVRWQRRFDRKEVRRRIAKADAAFQDLVGHPVKGALEAIDALRDQVEFRVRTLRKIDSRTSLRQYLEQLEAEGVAHNIPDSVVGDSYVQNYRQLTMDQFTDIIDAMRSAADIGMRRDELRLIKETRDRDQVMAEVAGSILEHGKSPKIKLTDTSLDRARREANNVLASILNADTITRELDGFEDNGAVHRHVKQVIDQAITERLIPMEETASQKLDELIDAHYTAQDLKELRKRRAYSEFGNLEMSRENILSIALNWGNASNRAALTEQVIFKESGITEETIQRLLDQEMTRNDWNFVQATWNLIDSYWPQIQATHRRRTGATPPKVQPTPVVTPFGTYGGGYYPLKYDGAKSAKAKQNEEADIIKAMTGNRLLRAATKAGHTKERVGSAGQPVLLDLSVIGRHVREVVRDLAIGDAVKYVDQVITDKRFTSALEQTGQQHKAQVLRMWLADTATGEMPPDGWFSRAARHARIGVSVTAMGLSIKTAIIQTAGLAPTAAVIGTSNMLVGLRDMVRADWSGEASIWRQVADRSAFMRHRSSTYHKDIMDAMDKVRGKPARKFIMQAAFYAIGKVQGLVDHVTWLGAYHQGITRGDTESQAVAHADTMVRRSQSSGLFSDRTAIERGTFSERTRQNEFIRATTTMMSYMLARNNVAYEKTILASRKIGEAGFFSRKGLKASVEYASDMLLLYVADALFGALLLGSWPDDDEDEGVIAWLGKETAKGIAGGIPVLNWAVSAADGFSATGPLGRMMEDAGRLGPKVEDGDFDMTFWRNLIKVGGTATHVPTKPVTQIMSAMEKEERGQDVSVLDYLWYREH